MSLKVVENVTAQQSTYDFLLLFRSNCGPILYHFPHIARYWLKLRTSYTLMPLYEVTPQEIHKDV